MEAAIPRFSTIASPYSAFFGSATSQLGYSMKNSLSDILSGVTQNSSYPSANGIHPHIGGINGGHLQPLEISYFPLRVHHHYAEALGAQHGVYGSTPCVSRCTDDCRGLCGLLLEKVVCQSSNHTHRKVLKGARWTMPHLHHVKGTSSSPSLSPSSSTFQTSEGNYVWIIKTKVAIG